MLLSSDELKGYTLDAKDGEIGRVKDFLFNDNDWVIRYLVADTAKWLVGRKVLLSPISLGSSDPGLKLIRVHLTRDEVKESPPLESDTPVSRQYEIKFHRHYGWPYYWHYGGVWGASAFPYELYSGPKPSEETEEPLPESGDPHLRSVNAVERYRVNAADDEAGHVEGFIIDDDSWHIRYLIIDTRNWLPGRRVLISPEWVKSVRFGDERIYTDLTRREIEGSPEYDPAEPVNREYETRLYDYLGRPYYW